MTPSWLIACLIDYELYSTESEVMNIRCADFNTVLKNMSFKRFRTLYCPCRDYDFFRQRQFLTVRKNSEWLATLLFFRDCLLFSLLFCYGWLFFVTYCFVLILTYGWQPVDFRALTKRFQSIVRLFNHIKMTTWFMLYSQLHHWFMVYIQSTMDYESR